MGNMRIWCKVYPDKDWPLNKVACGIEEIKKGDMFGFIDTFLGRSWAGASADNQWHYGVATKDSYPGEDGIWVVESEEVQTHVLEVS